MKYAMTCTCGDVMNVDADSKEEAVQKFKDMMDEDAVKAHFAEKHPGDEVPTQEQVAMNIESSVHLSDEVGGTNGDATPATND